MTPASQFRPVSRKAAKQRLVEDGRLQTFENGTLLDLDTREEFAREISGHWSQAQQKFVMIGRYLNRAKECLPHGEFDAMISSDLPFSRQIAYQLRVVAQAIDAGRLPVNNLPPSYSTIYQVAKLSDTELEEARDSGLIRPDVTRREVLAFQRSVKKRKTVPDLRPSLAILQRERARLLAERKRVEARIEEIDAQVAALTGSAEPTDTEDI